MAQIQLLGMTHYPPFGWADPVMSGLMKQILRDPGIPTEAKDPTTWPEPMQAEWGEDEGVTSAAAHRASLIDGFDRIRADLDAFDPEVVLIWGDDQYENYREDVVPAFSVLAYEDRVVHPYETKVGKAFPSYWDEPADLAVKIRGNRTLAKGLVTALLDDHIDVAYAYEPLHDEHLPHAFLNTVLFLDHRRTGFDIPIICMPINCYGSRVIGARGAWRPFGEAVEADPPSPSPARLMDVGAATARFLRSTDLKVSVIASSSWSHAFLTDHTWRLRPDTDADRVLYDAMVAADHDTWEEWSTEQIVTHGQQEVLNWCALLGAARELDASLSWCTFVETWVFNSNKVFASWTVST